MTSFIPLPRRAQLLLAVTLALAVGLPAAGHAQAVTAALTPDLVVFEDDTSVTVDLVLQNTAGVAGVDLTLEFPAERFVANPTFAEGTLGGLVEVNNLTAGRLIIVFARATGLTEDSGTLVSLTFSVPCEGNQDSPEGNPVDFTVGEFLAFDEASQELDVDTSAITLSLKCTRVATRATSFSVLKSRFGR